MKIKQNFKKSSIYSKIALILVPVALIVLIVSMVMCFMLRSNPDTGNLTIIMALTSTVLAFVGIILAIFGTGSEENNQSKDE